MKKKLQELLPFSYNILESDSSKLPEGVLMKIGGVFQRADAKNANNRVYPKDLWLEVLQRPDIKERIEKRRMVGMLGHPSSGMTDPEKISHIVTGQELRSDGTVYGEAEVLDTPTGRITSTMFKAGVGLGISSRGDGSIEKKGDKNEVQNDYRLETYDFVLKPSTPGAYPGMLSESTVEENEKLVAEAIDGLVNSESIPDDQRMGVLTECLQILSVLEASNSGNQVKTLSTKITEELKVHHPEVLLTIQANESVEPEFNPQSKLEGTMPYGKNPSQGGSNPPQLSADTLAWHQQQVNNAVSGVVAAKEQEIIALKDTVIKAQREHTETKKRLKAAESLIEEFTVKIKELEESAPADTELKIRYDAAVELLDEALTRLPEIGNLTRRTDTLESLLQASIDSVREDKLSTAVEERMAQVDKKFHDTVRPVLENCQTPEQVAETFKALMAVSGSSATPAHEAEPLPRSTPMNENQDPKPPVKSGYASLIGRRLSQAV